MDVFVENVFDTHAGSCRQENTTIDDALVELAATPYFHIRQDHGSLDGGIGMHSNIRWEENKDLRTEAQVKLNKKIGELEARARSVAPPKEVPGRERSSGERVTDNIFARLSSGTAKRFKTSE